MAQWLTDCTEGGTDHTSNGLAWEGESHGSGNGSGLWHWMKWNEWNEVCVVCGVWVGESGGPWSAQLAKYVFLGPIEPVRGSLERRSGALGQRVCGQK